MHASIQNPEPGKPPDELPDSRLADETETRGTDAAQRIAHVDDDPDIRDTVKRILSTNGYSVDSYQSMGDFLEALNDPGNHPDLAILDVMVETMDAGLDTYVEVRKRVPDLPMIFMTSLGEEIRPYFTNITDEWILIVEKPVEPVSFLSIVRNRLDNSKSKASSS